MASLSRAVSRSSTPAECPPSTASSSTRSAGPSLRSHLFNILPKHALFKVKLHIRQISNVPLLGGEFAVKWRFRNVQSPGGTHGGLLSMMRANSSTTTMTPKGKTKDYFPDSEDPHSTQSGYPWTGNGTTGWGTPDSSSSPDYPSPVDTTSSSSTFSVISPGGTSSLTSAVPGLHSDNRGITTWIELSDHTATWDHHVALTVRMDVDRETFDLHESELKLTVLQVCALISIATWRETEDVFRKLLQVTNTNPSARVLVSSISTWPSMLALAPLPADIYCERARQTPHCRCVSLFERAEFL